MRKIVAMVAAAAVAIPTGFAVASPGKGPVNGKAPEKTANPNPNSGSKPKVCRVPKRQHVKYIIRGVLTKDATATELEVDVTKVNNHAKKALAGPTATGGGAYNVPMLKVTIDACTHITKSGKGTSKRTFAALKAGDRVVIGWRAKKGTAYVDLGAAVRVADIGPAK